MIKPWEKVRSTPVGDFRIFTIRSDVRTSPRTGSDHDFFVIDCVNWVHVLAVTEDDQLVMVEQYRHGSETVELEIPGGMMDAHEQSPVEAALRELREETGYEGTNGQIIGEVFANPAIMSNTCYFVRVDHCQLRHAIELDHGEDVATRLVPLSEIPALVAANKIKHSIVVAGLFYHDLWLRNHPSIQPAT